MNFMTAVSADIDQGSADELIAHRELLPRAVTYSFPAPSVDPGTEGPEQRSVE